MHISQRRRFQHQFHFDRDSSRKATCGVASRAAVSLVLFIPAECAPPFPNAASRRCTKRCTFSLTRTYAFSTVYISTANNTRILLRKSYIFRVLSNRLSKLPNYRPNISYLKWIIRIRNEDSFDIRCSENGSFFFLNRLRRNEEPE